MDADELHLNSDEALGKGDYPSIIVALDIKDNATAFENACVTKLRFDVSGAGPACLLTSSIQASSDCSAYWHCSQNALMRLMVIIAIEA